MVRTRETGRQRQLLWLSIAVVGALAVGVFVVAPSPDVSPAIGRDGADETATSLSRPEAELEPVDRSGANPETGNAGAASPPARRNVEDGLPTVRGRVVDSEGRPIQGAAVHITARFKKTLSEVGSTQTDERGRFELVADSLRALGRGGRNKVTGSAEAPGYQVAHFACRSNRASPLDWRGHARLLAGVTLVGQVVDADDRPADGADVWIVRWKRPGEVAEAAHVRADGAGFFRIGTDRADSVYLVASRRWADSAALAVRVDGEPGPIDVGRLTLAGPRTLTGSVVDTTGFPVPYLPLRVVNEFPSSGTRGGTTDALGRFRIPDVGVGLVRFEADLKQVQADRPAGTRSRRAQPKSRSKRAITANATHSQPTVLRESDDPRGTLYPSGRDGYNLVFPGQRLRVVVEDPTGEPTTKCQVRCVPLANLDVELARLATARGVSPQRAKGRPPALDFAVTTGDALAAIAFVPRGGKRPMIRLLDHKPVHVATTPRQIDVTLRLKAD